MTIKVLLADDHPSLRAGIRQRLEREEDIQVVGEAATGADVLRLVDQTQPHVLVLDMQMPDISGAEVARRLREDGAAVRILALSAHGDLHYISRLLESGASGYLLKHEPLETIVAAVRGVANGEEGWLSRDVAASLMKQRRAALVADDDPLTSLSEREREVLVLIARGHTNQQIAEELFISENTVKKHVNSIYAKLETENRAGVAAFAWRRGLVDETKS